MKNNKSRLGFFCSINEKNNIIRFLLNFYIKKKYKIYNYKLGISSVDNGIVRIKDYPKLKKKEIIFAKISKPLDYILFNKSIKKTSNIISFLSGPSFYLPINFYDYLIFQKNNLPNKIKVKKVFRNLLNNDDNFDLWWSKLNKKWIIIDTEEKTYHQTNDLFEIFNDSKITYNDHLSFNDYLFDMYY